jgi:hypothetical protein
MSEDVEAFVEKLLKASPGAPHSVELELDIEEDIHAFFEVLLLIMTNILKAWYPPPITIGMISDEDYLRLRDYFASFGMKIALTVREVPRVLRLNNRDYLEQSQLEDMKFQMVHLDKLYTVIFSRLPMA